MYASITPPPFTIPFRSDLWSQSKSGGISISKNNNSSTPSASSTRKYRRNRPNRTLSLQKSLGLNRKYRHPRSRCLRNLSNTSKSYRHLNR